MDDSVYRIDAADAKRLALRLLDEDERIAFNMFELILRDPDAFAWSDGESFLFAQTDRNAPLWGWLSDDADEDGLIAAACLAAARAAENPRLLLNLETPKAESFLRVVCKISRRNFSARRDLNALVCRRLVPPPARGELITPSNADRAAVANLLIQLIEDGERQRISQSEADSFAWMTVGSRRLGLWRAGGEICSMAMIAHESRGIARLNTVVTDRTKRGRGCAGMLLAAMSRELLDAGKLPMLYVDAANSSADRAFRKIGFEKVGEITEYRCGE